MTAPYYEADGVTLYLGDSREVLRTLPDQSVDAVVTDPPYGLEFMGKEWDTFKPGGKKPGFGKPDGTPFRQNTGTPSWGANGNPSCRNCRKSKYDRGERRCRCDNPDFGNHMAGHMRAFQEWCEGWAAECLRVLKPGGYLLAFGGTRTYHRLACAIEDAGFEIRDSITHYYGKMAWIYGSGFPKSLAVSRDESFCQCLPNVRRSAPGDAAEPEAEVLLPSLRRTGEADPPDGENLHGLPVGIPAGHALPSSQEQDLLTGVCGGVERRGEAGHHAGSESRLPSLRRDVHPEEQYGEESGEVLLDNLLGEGPQRRPSAPSEDAGHIGAWLESNGRQAQEGDERREEPCLEGRGDIQAPEGQLHRSALRPLSSGVRVDVEVGRVRDGAPAGHGAVDRSALAADRGGEPQGPQSEEQRPVESGAVSEQRGSQAWRGWPVCAGCGKPVVPAGLGTALKPGHETIVVARRPLAGTVAHNVLTYGTGALNVNGCRVEGPADNARVKEGGYLGYRGGDRPDKPYTGDQGRWPTNLVFTHSAACVEDGPCVGDCPVAELDRQSGVREGGHHPVRSSGMGFSGGNGTRGGSNHRDAPGGASRFFPAFRFEAKAGAAERPRLPDGTAHPTVKPLALLRWLVRLVTPPGGTVLDPFAGSGTTGEACLIEGFNAVLVELEPAHAELVKARLSKAIQPALDFGEAIA